MTRLVCMHDRALAEGVRLDLIGSTSLSVGDDLLLQVNGTSEQIPGRVPQMMHHGARPVIESEGKRWWLTPVNVVHLDIPCRTWKVGGLGDGD